MNPFNFKVIRIVYALLFISLWTMLQSQSSSEPTWNAVGGGLYGAVHTMLSHGDDLYVGGEFFHAGDIEDANLIARWDGEAWHALGEGPYVGIVEAMVIYNGELYIGGAFAFKDQSSGARVARWDGVTWHVVASSDDIHHIVKALAVFQGHLYIAGVFENGAGLEEGDHIIRWDGSTFSSVGGGIKNVGHWVKALAADDQNLYVGGSFGNVGDTPTNNIGRWDGTNWHSMDGGWDGPDYAIWSLAIAGQYLYAGGDGGPVNSNACGIARWDGNKWDELGTGLSCEAYKGARSIEGIGDSIFVGGIFDQAGGTPYTSRFAGYDGQEWFSFGNPTGDPYSYLMDGGVILAIQPHKQDLYIGGVVYIDGVERSHNIARWGLPSMATSISDTESGSLPLSVSPNVTDGYFTYDFGYMDAIHSITVYNILGKEVYRDTRTDMTGNIGNLPAGFYLIHIEKDGLYGVTRINKY